MAQQGTADMGNGPGLDEAQMEQALQHLNLLHVKSRVLRETIPKMLEPLAHRGPSPEDTFKAFKVAAEGAVTDVKEFTELMKDEESQKVFVQARQSEQSDPADIKTWRHKDNPDWFSVSKV